ncbi:endoplasmic reticulum-based factor for assembly of V-ATPase-domain-containing protein [Immersiella caudata]|uniref:Endoplasmic reticulum-based factor for assembly of V-ATPase-domain-containing protein n=1 Tax=Immersiella caudata TaxID=314043 RepID=A0AA39WCU1_9PEZI|nr:endoplasmic reticulum-based factor for assembly of V-ATPase-domain-containing protein [Immersiella caudata]
MVLLTITPFIAEGLQARTELAHSEQRNLQRCESDPALDDVAVGNPISHGQIIDLWTELKDGGLKQYTLEQLLKSSRVYIPPPPPKPEPSEEYKALMTRLRREEEQRAYERMTNPLSPLETFSQRFPNQSKMAQSFAEANRPGTKDDLGDDGVTYDDVHRQLILILNFLVSIFGVAGTLWVLARWWSTPARLFLTLGGSILVGIAEVGLYSGYIWHLGEEKKKEKRKEKAFKEVKQVVETWVVGQGSEEKGSEKLPAIESNISLGEGNLRRRKLDEVKQ